MYKPTKCTTYSSYDVRISAVKFQILGCSRELQILQLCSRELQIFKKNIKFSRTSNLSYLGMFSRTSNLLIIF